MLPPSLYVEQNWIDVGTDDKWNSTKNPSVEESYRRMLRDHCSETFLMCKNLNRASVPGTDFSIRINIRSQQCWVSLFLGVSWILVEMQACNHGPRCIDIPFTGVSELA
jgi:hypothetical protein